MKGLEFETSSGDEEMMSCRWVSNECEGEMTKSLEKG